MRSCNFAFITKSRLNSTPLNQAQGRQLANILSDQTAQVAGYFFRQTHEEELANGPNQQPAQVAGFSLRVQGQ
jgi:hypothetical protein